MGSPSDPIATPLPDPTGADALATASDPVEETAAAAAVRLVLAAEPPSMLDGKVHIGIAVGLRTGEKPSALVVPDVLGVADGSAPVYLAKPLKLKLKRIQKYLEAKAPAEKKGLDDNPKLKRFLTNTDVAINSLYFRNSREAKAAVPADPKASPATKEVPAVTELKRLLLMQFEVDFAAAEKALTPEEQQPGGGGLIGSLTGDKDLSELFDITSVSLRVLQCDEENVEILQKYIDAVSED
jgi:hypothetical protein